MLIWHWYFFFAKFEYEYQNSIEFYADFEFVKKNAKNFEFILFYTSYMQKFLANNFFWVHFFQLFPQIWNQRKILRIFNTHMQKKKYKFCWCHYVNNVNFGTSKMKIRKK